MKWMSFTILLIVLTILNSGNLLNAVSITPLHIRPDLLLIFLIFVAIHADGRDAMIASFFIGLAADISGITLGPYTVSFVLFGTMFSSLRQALIMQAKWHQGLTIFIAGLLACSTAQFLSFFKTEVISTSIFLSTLGTAAYSGIVGPFLWSLFSMMSNVLGVRKYSLGRTYSR